MNKQQAISKGERVARGFFGTANKVTWYVVAENTQTGEHYLLAGTPDKGDADRIRDKWQREYFKNPFGVQPYMRVSVIRSV